MHLDKIEAVKGRPPAAQAPTGEGVDLSEKGRRDGEVISFDRRLFMQFMAFGGCTEIAAVMAAMEENGVQGAIYEDINDPQGIAIVTLSEDPAYFLGTVRKMLNQPPFSNLIPKPEHTMFGRTYSQGYEPDLEEALIRRPTHRVTDPALPWVVWYPLRRAGSFEQLTPDEQRVILMEHSGIGMAFGRAGLGHDVRLACHGLDKFDNDFVIGLLGPELYPLSCIVQRMRKTKQTSQHLERLGPFWIGKVAWQSK